MIRLHPADHRRLRTEVQKVSAVLARFGQKQPTPARSTPRPTAGHRRRATHKRRILARRGQDLSGHGRDRRFAMRPRHRQALPLSHPATQHLGIGNLGNSPAPRQAPLGMIPRYRVAVDQPLGPSQQFERAAVDRPVVASHVGDPVIGGNVPAQLGQFSPRRGRSFRSPHRSAAARHDGRQGPHPRSAQPHKIRPAGRRGGRTVRRDQRQGRRGRAGPGEGSGHQPTFHPSQGCGGDGRGLPIDGKF